MIKGTTIISNGPGYSQIMVATDDGKNYFLTLYSESASISLQPDDKHYPTEFAYGRLPTEFQSHGS